MSVRSWRSLARQGLLRGRRSSRGIRRGERPHWVRIGLAIILHVAQSAGSVLHSAAKRNIKYLFTSALREQVRGRGCLGIFPLHPRVGQGIRNHLLGRLDAKARNLKQHDRVRPHPVALRLRESIQCSDHRLSVEAQARDAHLFREAFRNLNEVIHFRGIGENPSRAHRSTVQGRGHFVRGGDLTTGWGKDDLKVRRRVKLILINSQASRAAINIVIRMLIIVLLRPAPVA